MLLANGGVVSGVRPAAVASPAHSRAMDADHPDRAAAVEAADDKDDVGNACCCRSGAAHCKAGMQHRGPDDHVQQLEQQPPRQAWQHKKGQVSHEGHQIAECCEEKQHQAVAQEAETSVQALQQNEPLRQQDSEPCGST